MAFKTTRRIAGGVAGSALLALGAATAAGGAAAAQPQIADADPSSTTHVVNDREVLAHWIDVDDASVRLANVEGSFSFNQEGTTPNDELFNVFGTALTSMLLEARRRARRRRGRAWRTSTSTWAGT